MHFLRLSINLLVPLVCVAPALGLPNPKAGCNPRASGKGLEAAQQAAIDDFARLILMNKDAQAAFDKYIPGTYIQHSAGIAEPGRQATLDLLVPLFTSPGIGVSHLRTFVSKGTGILHYKLDVGGGLEGGGTSAAIVDLFRFEGTCIVEHWDALQRITGEEVNPVAFF